MDTYLIGLTGPDGGARDTVANLLSVQGWEVRELQDNIRECLYDLDPLVGAEVSLCAIVNRDGWPSAMSHRIYGPEVNRLVTELDGLLQSIAGPAVWVDLLAQDLQDSGGMPGPGTGRRVVVPDLTTPEQAAWVRETGGQVWGIGACSDREFSGGAGLIDVHLDTAEHPSALACAVEEQVTRQFAA